jgi:hypothetical protein
VTAAVCIANGADRHRWRFEERRTIMSACRYGRVSSFADLQYVLNNFIQNNDIDIGASPHGAFWQTDYNTFTTGNVPNVQPAVRIVVPGDPAGSGIVQALSGLPPFDGSSFRRMPAGGPFLDDSSINQIRQWVQDGCPE